MTDSTRWGMRRAVLGHDQASEWLFASNSKSLIFKALEQIL